MTTLTQKLTREEVAKLEIGHTDIHHGLATALVVTFVAFISAPGAFQVAWEQAAYTRGDRATRRPQCVEIFLRVRTARDAWRQNPGISVIRRLQNANAALLREMHEYEDRLENESIFAGALRRPAQYVLTAVLGVGNEKSYCGYRPWLFYRPDVDHVIRRGFLDRAQLAARASSGTEWRASPQPNPVPAIVDFRDQLAERGIQLVVLPVPVKPMLHPDALFAGAKHYPRYNSSWAEFLEALRSRGVMVFDATPCLAEHRAANRDAFLKTDTHWTSEAMQRIARELATFLRQNGLVTEQNGIKATERVVSVEGTGDLVTMLQLPEHAHAYPTESVKIRQIVGSRGEVWRPDSKAEILLLGDSFANIYSLDALGWGASAGFAEQLSFELGMPLDVIAINDNGAYATRDQLARELKRGRDRLAGKKVVIYEFAARELSDGDWRMIPLKLETPPARRFITPPKGQAWRVRATVLAIAPVPLPGTVPYKDHVVAVHLGDVRAEGEVIQGGEALCYFLSMKDHEWTRAARWRNGEEIEIILRPWSDVAASYEGINRSELDDEELQWAEPYWGELPPRTVFRR